MNSRLKDVLYFLISLSGWVCFTVATWKLEPVYGITWVWGIWLGATLFMFGVELLRFLAAIGVFGELTK